MICEQKDDVRKNLADLDHVLVVREVYSHCPFCREENREERTPWPSGKGRVEVYDLFPGIRLSFVEIQAPCASFPGADDGSVLEIRYGRSARLSWEMKDGDTLYLGPGEFSVHAVEERTGSPMTLPMGYWSGIVIAIDLPFMEAHPPEILREAGVTGHMVRENFLHGHSFTAFPGGRQACTYFEDMYNVPDEQRTAFLKLKVQEILLHLSRIPDEEGRDLSQYQADQIDTIRSIHAYCVENLHRKISIDELSRRFLMNTTTLKTLFKVVYGSSIGAHIKEHRMERAAVLLRETEDSISAISRAVGYESQSKFTAAFKDIFGISPTVYRKSRAAMQPTGTACCCCETALDMMPQKPVDCREGRS